MSQKLEMTTDPSLADYCVPGQEHDIAMVVATLAKIYAQRLVATAVKLRAERNPDTAVAVVGVTPLQPLEIQRACRYRQAQGLDPGFFLASSSTAATASTYNAQDEQDLRLAALQAEQEYDAWKQQPKQQHETMEDLDKATTTNSSTPMQVDEDTSASPDKATSSLE